MCIIEIDLISELRDQIASELQHHESTDAEASGAINSSERKHP